MDSFKPAVKYLSRYVGLIVFGVLTIVGIYVIWSFIVPKYQEIQAIRREVADLTQKRDELTAYVAYLHELETTTLPFEEELVNYAIPSENDVISLIVTYEGLSKTPDMEVSPFDLTPGLITSTDPNAKEKAQGGAITSGQSGQTGTQSRELEFRMEAKTLKPEVAMQFLGQIHKTRRVFTIKSLIWQNPLKENANDASDRDKIILSFNLGTYYYPTAPTVAGSAELVNKGKTQGNFISQLSSTTIYDGLILESVPVGKEDLFTKDTSVVPLVQPTPTAVILPGEEITSGGIDLNVAPTSATETISPPIIF